MLIPTNTDTGGPHDWWIEDPVLHLRDWATRPPIPFPEVGHGTIGSLPDNWLQLFDPTGFVSKYHARIARSGSRWGITDLDSKNGIKQDGFRRLTYALSPGVEIGIGGVTLIAESARFIALRELLSRLIGWSDDRLNEIDLALRAVRMAATRRGSLLLCGDGDVVALAQQLHRLALGEERPFIVCDPRRRRSDSTARAAANYDSGMDALHAAAGGSLCIWQQRQPDDFDAVVAAVKEPSSRVQLVVCTHELDHGAPLIATPVVFPPLGSRGHEIDAIIDAYGVDAVAALGGELTTTDRAWIRNEEAATIGEIEIAAKRIVALRACDGSITRAATLLGMSHGALSEWVARRTLPVPTRR